MYTAIICLANKRCPNTNTKRDSIYTLFISPTFPFGCMFAHFECQVWFVVKTEKKANWLKREFLLEEVALSCLQFRFMFGATSASEGGKYLIWMCFWRLSTMETWSALKKWWPVMQCCCFDQQRLAFKISRLSFSAGLKCTITSEKEWAANAVFLFQMNVTTVRENLPKGDFSVMTEMLKKFLNFMNLTVSAHGFFYQYNMQFRLSRRYSTVSFLCI